jgi:hypothetical protein
MNYMRSIAIVAVALVGCRPSASPAPLSPENIILGAATVSTAGGTLQSGSLWMQEGLAAVAFAPAQPGQNDLEFSWVALIKNDWSNALHSGKSNQTISPIVQTDGTVATAGIKVEINGKKFELLDRFRIDPKAKALVDEALQVNDKPQDLKAGRVFLVDLTTQPPTVEQRAIALPGPAATVKDVATILEAAARARDLVTQKDEVARRFVGATNKR